MQQKAETKKRNKLVYAFKECTIRLVEEKMFIHTFLQQIFNNYLKKHQQKHLSKSLPYNRMELRL